MRTASGRSAGWKDPGGIESLGSCSIDREPALGRGWRERLERGPRPVKAAYLAVTVVLALLTSCTPAITRAVYRDPNMDFGAIQNVGVMPFQNLSRDSLAADRVRDVFINRLLSTGALYVQPIGEVARAVGRLEIPSPTAPSPEEVIKLGGALKVQAVITGVVQEYGEVRSGSSSANLISVSVQMLEAQTGRTVWTASSTKGGISVWDRLFGGGGQPMNDVTRDAVNDLIAKLFK
jgi:TolB-like protein